MKAQFFADKDSEWVKKYGDEAINAALAIIGGNPVESTTDKD